MTELMVEMESSFQPYCQKRNKNGVVTFNSLLYQDFCPPWSHVDIIFVADVSKGTSEASFKSMTSTIRGIVSKLAYGLNGIRAGFAQYHDKVSLSIRLNRYPTTRSFLRGLARTARLNPGNSRNSGKALDWVAKKKFNLSDEASVVRPHHTPVVVLLTSGPSSDNVQAPIRNLISRKVNLIHIGPGLTEQRSPFYTTIRTENATSFHLKTDKLLSEICQVDRNYRSSTLQPPTIEEMLLDGASPLQTINRYFLGFGLTHLPLLWRPQPVRMNTSTSTQAGSAERGIGTGNTTGMDFMEDFMEGAVY